MSIQSLKLKSIPYDTKVIIVSFLNLESVLKVTRLDKEFYTVAGEREIWRSLANRILVPKKFLSGDPKEDQPKRMLINQITDRIYAFLFLRNVYQNFSARTIWGKTSLLSYKNILGWFANNPNAIEEICTIDSDLSETNLDLLIDTDSHAKALIHENDELQAKRKTQKPAFVEI